MTRLGADGSIKQTEGDYLLIVDSNLGFNKVNVNVQQQIEYAVDLHEPDRVEAHLAVSYENRAAIRLPECILDATYGLTYDDMTQRCYWDYVRVYAPLGSTALLRQDSPDVEVMQEGDKRTFATYFALAPGQSHQLSLDYLLPPGVLHRDGRMYHYVLLVQKQAGTPDQALRVTVALPGAARLLAASPQSASFANGRLVFDVVLDRDRTFEVTYAR